MRERRGDDLEAWRAEATHSGIDALARFAQGLQDDLSAITTGLTLEWNNGVTEGQIHRLKLVKRQGVVSPDCVHGFERFMALVRMALS
jgi:transposase